MRLLCDTWGQRICKSDTKLMNLLLLLCFVVCKQIKDALNVCLAWKRMILYCFLFAVMVQVLYLMEMFGFHAVKLKRICYADSYNLPCIFAVPLTLLNSWLHGIINTKQTLHGQLYMYGFAVLVCSVKSECSLIL